MTENPNKLLQFWQELKRRKVVKVIALYATTAFFLVQIVYILVEPLHLPAWVMSLFTVLLIIGFSQFEEVNGKMRILTIPDRYIIDQDHSCSFGKMNCIVRLAILRRNAFDDGKN
jgi:hypothetical protein